MTPYLLLLCGPLCSGKTTVVDLLLKTEPHLIRISRDKIKRFISDWKIGNEYKAFLDESILHWIDFSFKAGLNVVVEGNVLLRESFKKVAAENNARFVELNLEAPLEILTKRFHERLAVAKKENRKMFCTEEERMLDRYHLYQKMKDPEARTIMTNEFTPDELHAEIKKILV